MVFAQPRDVMLQRVEAGRRQDAGLTQPAAGHLAPAQRALNEGFAAAQQRSDRRAQPFRQANGEGVAVLHDLFQRQVQRHGGVEDARAVDMQRQLPLAGKLPRLLQVGLRQDSAADGVFQAQQPGAGEVDIVGFDGGGELVQRQRAVRVSLDRLRLDAAQHRCAAGLVFIVVRLLADQILVAALAVAQQRHQVGLGAAGQKQRRLFARQAHRLGLQRVDRRVIAVDVVADLCLSHRLAHGGAGAGDGVAA
ncbi:Uncharacterised protein [Serratia marcescens]|nr:Uncharacterised protein [Serratia marcescens]CUZ53433.1 Uncharacterised protein [Serratia marcescens]CVB57183.1 Uncharacterised protein [Serratia marcescens]CVF59223.1 Uncharacterised protein [Serratia marcescens]